jgi:dihydroorotase
MNLYISNGLIVDPVNKLSSLGSLVIEDGIIREISLYQNGRPGPETATPPEGAVILDAGGKWVVPGLIDIHVHLREPGFEHKEDIASGCAGAAKGGFTTICCMPNTEPVIDSSYVVLMIDSRAKEGNGVQVLSIGAMTKGQEGKELADYEAMVRTGTNSALLAGRGICGVSEDGKTVADGELMRAAMKRAKELDLTVFSHAEPESEIVERDLSMAEAVGCKLHFCHVSEKRSIELIREAKDRGVPVTAETAPHYFALSGGDVKGDPNKKMNPPLRRAEDVEAVRQALKDGTIDVIATDHAPHHEREKGVPFEEAPNGVIGLETSFAVSYTELVKTGILSPLELISKMSTKPAEILRIDRGSLWVGKTADLAIIDVERGYEIDPEDFASKSKNTPFAGKQVFGQILYTIVGGKVVFARP